MKTWTEVIADFRWRGQEIPDHMRAGLVSYLEKGVEPGGFLRAVLANDLVGSVKKADSSNQGLLPVYAGFIYNYLPPAAHGSYEKVDSWDGASH